METQNKTAEELREENIRSIVEQVEIIKKGKQVLHYRGQCPNCKTIFRCKHEELCNVTFQPLYAYCPECNHLTTMRVETPKDFIGNK